MISRVGQFIFVVSLFLYGCKGVEKGKKIPKDKEEIVVCYHNVPSTLDPHFQDEVPAMRVLINTHNALVRLNQDMGVVPDVATRWETISNTLWKFQIKDGITFHNGKELSSKDVVFSLLRAKNSPNSHVSPYLMSIDTVWSEGSKVFIKLNAPQSIFINKLSFIYIVPAGSSFENSLDLPIGTGDFKVEEFSENLIVLKNVKGVGNFEKAIFRYIEDHDKRAAMFLQGECDIIYGILYSSYLDKVIERKDLKLKSRVGLSTYYLSLKVSVSPFSDRFFRKAVHLLLDRERAVKVFAKGFGIPLNQLAPPTVFGYLPDLPPFERNVMMAKELLNLAGFEDGVEVTLTAVVSIKDLAQVVADSLAEGGITVKLNLLEWQDVYPKLGKGEVDFYLGGWFYQSGDISDFFESKIHTKRGIYGRLNTTDYSNARVDKLIEMSTAVMNIDERRRILEEISYIVLEDLPYIPVLSRANVIGMKGSLDLVMRSDGFLVIRDISVVE